ncbi:MAG TPA: inorganic diphosphatase, partial [Tenuifilaceae bacterium]|nr:inorganic diphosphatase [Tenuifilaceae bacterium]
DCPALVIDRLKHYFLTYKDLPGEKRHCEITHIYGIEEAQQIIAYAMQDYTDRFYNLESMLKI